MRQNVINTQYSEAINELLLYKVALMGLKNIVLKEKCEKMHKITFYENNFQGIIYLYLRI